MSQFYELKNKECLDILELVDLDDITEIHQTYKPSYQLLNLMISVNLLLDLPQKWEHVCVETYSP